jgi:CubicO group peptidase (beta-lactamase class C family)
VGAPATVGGVSLRASWRLLLVLLLAVGAVACSDDGADDDPGPGAVDVPAEEDPTEAFCDEADELADALGEVVGDAEAQDELAELRSDADELIAQAEELEVDGEAEDELADCVGRLQDVMAAADVSGRAPLVDTSFPGAEFETGSPEDHGLDPAALRALDAYAEAHGSNCVSVVHDGVLVHDRYWNGTDVETNQEIFSATKSITSFLVGIAQDRGLLDLDDPAADYIPEWAGTPAEAVTVRDLLSNDSGRHYDFQTDYLEMAAGAEDKSAFAIALAQDDPPGSVWVYNNSAIQTLEQVLEVATGEDVADFAEANLFAPIGMTTTINHDPAGNTLAFMGGQASCQDLARFGLLALNLGNWDGEQVVSAAYVQEALAPSQDLNSVYGFLWWLNSDGPRVAGLDGSGARIVDDGSLAWPDAPPDTVAAQGLGGQLSIVVPSEGLVITRLGPSDEDAATNDLVRLVLG